MVRNPAIAPAEKTHDGRDAAQLPKRPGPPEAPGDFPQGVRAAENRPTRFQQAHLRQQFRILKPNPCTHPWRLQRQQFELPMGERPVETPGQPEAEAAFGIVEHPAFKFVFICNFSIHRNVIPKIFSCRFPVPLEPCRPLSQTGPAPRSAIGGSGRTRPKSFQKIRAGPAAAPRCRGRSSCSFQPRRCTR